MSKVPITVRGAEKLKNELQKLKSEDRPKVIEAIAEGEEEINIDIETSIDEGAQEEDEKLTDDTTEEDKCCNHRRRKIRGREA